MKKIKTIFFITITTLICFSKTYTGTLHCSCHEGEGYTLDPVSVSVGSFSEDAYNQCRVLCAPRGGVAHVEVR